MAALNKLIKENEDFNQENLELYNEIHKLEKENKKLNNRIDGIEKENEWLRVIIDEQNEKIAKMQSKKKFNEYDALSRLTDEIIEQMNEEGWRERQFGSAIPHGDYYVDIDVTIKKEK